MLVLVAYDVANPKRLRRAAKLMQRYGRRVQRSVFECELGEERLARMIDEVRAVIRRREDKVSIYRLCGDCRRSGAGGGTGGAGADGGAIVV